MKPGLGRIIAAGFKRPALVVGLCLEIVVLISPAIYLYGKEAPTDIAMMSMFLGPLYLMMNSVLKDIQNHLQMRIRFVRLQRILMINMISGVLAGILAINATSVYLIRFILAGYTVSWQEYLGYFIFEFSYLFLVGTIHNFSCELCGTRLPAFGFTLFLIIGEYVSASFPNLYRFIFAYQAVYSALKQGDLTVYLFFFLFSELLLILSTFVSREVIK
ncbi:MAG: hypothetical protein VB070_00425 [Clostridiaceae bacterium]|nr:hypothetical protein [Clostridiaceae bacterium]